ncbi:MAG: recombinase family protein [Planctomycetaceae bacterium]
MTRSKKPPKIRCAIYTRKSTDEGLDQEFNTLDAQREAGEAYIASQKAERWTCLPQRYDDGGYTGGNVERPALQQLLADIEAGKIDCVVVYKVDRLSRSLLDFARIMATFDDRKVSFVSVTQHFNTTHPMGRLTLNILLSFAQFEREIIGERIRDKLAAQCRKGKWIGGPPVLGYDVDRTGPSPKLVINPKEAVRVRRIFDLYLELESSLPVIEQLRRLLWRNKSWRTKRGRERGGQWFDRGALLRLLRNRLYIGQVRHKDRHYDGEHEPIVERDVFDRVQRRLEQNRRTRGVDVRNKYGAMLKRLLYCKACERLMVHVLSGKRGGGKQYRYYVCTKAIHEGRKACPARSLPAGEIERVVLDEIRTIGQDRRLRAEVLKQIENVDKKKLKELQKERTGLQRQLSRHEADFERLAKNSEPADVKADDMSELAKRIAAGKERIGEIDAAVSELESRRIDRSDVDAAFADFDAIWQAMTRHQQVRLLRLLIDRVEFDAADGSIEIAFHESGIKTLATETSV